MNYRIIPISQYSDDSDLSALLRKLNIGLTVAEARQVCSLIGRDPSIVELFIFDIEWSEHCSYKSSKRILKKYMPTQASNVVLGVGEDAGIIYFTATKNREYGIVMAHESHNHPSQVLPVEGAATGIGGIVRDVDCMGAHVCAVADALRFGNPNGQWKARTRWNVAGVIDGIWQYGNALGVPNLCGDVYFDDCYDDNCLVNVVSLGIVPIDNIIHSAVPPEARHEDFDLILVGKPTDASGFGGVTFASEILDEAEEARQLGAVQVHDPFLKNILITRKANRMVIDRAIAGGYPIGMKDLGGGGLACASSEICHAGGFGAEIWLDKVHTSMADLPPEVIACGETQERFLLAVPRVFTDDVLRIYNNVWCLPAEANGAQAVVIGKTRNDMRYRLWFQGDLVCDAPIDAVTSGIEYHRESTPASFQGTEPEIPTVSDYGEILVSLLDDVNLCSRWPIYKHYDTEVQGCAVIRPGEADAGIMAPLSFIDDSPAGLALTVDGNPYIGKLSPYWSGAVSVAEAMRNIIATGAVPRGLTDCLNYGNPEKPDAFWEFEEGVKGISDAARNLWQIGTNQEPVPIVSGNVSFYNESAAGKAINPSPVIACAGIIDDYSRAVTMNLKSPGNTLILVGQRRDEMGGSAFFRIHHGVTGTRPLTIDWQQERKDMHAVSKVLDENLAVASHDISDGGLAVALAEMLLSHRSPPRLGARLKLTIPDLSPHVVLFSETGGFILEIPEKYVDRAGQILRQHGAWFRICGRVTREPVLVIDLNGQEFVNKTVNNLRDAWGTRMKEVVQ